MLRNLHSKKELFSLAYINAVAAHAGFQVCEPKIDFDGIDGTLMGDEGQRPRIEFQAKGTSREILKEDHLAYPLAVDTYEKLRANTIIPRILIVVLIPEEENEWVAHSEEELLLRHCGYWRSFSGEPASENQTSVTVHIPRTNVFESNQLIELMNRMQAGEPL